MIVICLTASSVSLYGELVEMVNQADFAFGASLVPPPEAISTMIEGVEAGLVRDAKPV